nr:hypothetical protein [Tanacetum cinerariifolium]
MRDSTAQSRFKSESKHFNDSLIIRGNTLQSDEDRKKFNELMALCTTLQNRVLELEKTKTSQHNEIANSKRRVKKLEKRNRSRTHKLKRLYKVGLTARVESLDDEESLGEYASKQGRTEAINVDKDVTLVNDHDDPDKDMFDLNVLVNATQDSTVTTTITTKEITLAQALKALKTSKPKGKAIMIEEPVKPKKKDQIRLDEEAAKRLQAEFNEEARLGREKVVEEQEANIALIETWDDIQAKIDVNHQLAERLQSRRENEQILNTSSKEKDNVYLPKEHGRIQAQRLKLKEFDKIQEMFDSAFKRVNTFEDIRTELVKGKEKREREELIQESTKNQKVENDKEIAEPKKLMKIILDKEEVAIDAIPLAIKSL